MYNVPYAHFISRVMASPQNTDVNVLCIKKGFSIVIPYVLILINQPTAVARVLTFYLWNYFNAYPLAGNGFKKIFFSPFVKI